MNRFTGRQEKRERPDHNKNGRRENLFMTTFEYTFISHFSMVLNNDVPSIFLL
jgi:hypothetical protein